MDSFSDLYLVVVQAPVKEGVGTALGMRGLDPVPHFLSNGVLICFRPHRGRKEGSKEGGKEDKKEARRKGGREGKGKRRSHGSQ